MSEQIPTPDDQSLEAQIRQLSRHLAAGTGRLLHLLAEFSLSRRWEAYGATSCAAWLSDECGFAPSTARERVRVANALLHLPQLREALRHGEISYSKCRIVTRHATPETEADYLAQALSMTVAQLERKLSKPREPREGGPEQGQEGAVSWRILRNGNVKVEAILTPDQFETFAAGLASAHDDVLAADQDVAAAGDLPEETPASEDVAPDATPTVETKAAPVFWFAGERSGRAGIEVLVAMARSQLRTAPARARDGRPEDDGSATAAGPGDPADVAA
jgi:hypothetical protein